jgi:hypothetical protein
LDFQSRAIPIVGIAIGLIAMSKSAFSCDGTNQFFCVAGLRTCHFFCAGHPTKLLSQTWLPHTQISFISSIADSNIITIVAQGTNDVQIWDRLNASHYSSIHLDAAITGLRLRPDVLVVVCDTRVFVYNLASIQQIATLNTAPNPAGAVAVECSYSSLVLAVPSGDEPGRVDIYDCLDPSAPIREINAFDKSVKTIKALEFSRDRALIAVASDFVHEIVIFSTYTGQRLRSLAIGKRDKVVRLLFDEFAMHLSAQFDGKFVNLYQLPIMDETVPVKAGGPMKPDTSYSLSKPFWAFFGSKLFELYVVTEDLVITRLKFEMGKGLKEIAKQNLKELPGMYGVN